MAEQNRSSPRPALGHVQLQALAGGGDVGGQRQHRDPVVFAASGLEALAPGFGRLVLERYVNTPLDQQNANSIRVGQKLFVPATSP